MQKLLTFFSAKILAYLPYLMVKVLMIRELTTSLVFNNWARKNICLVKIGVRWITAKLIKTHLDNQIFTSGRSSLRN